MDLRQGVDRDCPVRPRLKHRVHVLIRGGRRHAFGGTGIVTPETLQLFWIGLPAVLIGTWLGLKLYGRLDEATFRVVVLVLLFASGLTLLPWQWSKHG